MLDVSTQANLLALVKAQMLPNGGSVLFISHDWALTNFIAIRSMNLMKLTN